MFYHRAMNCGHRTGKEEELIRFGIGRAEKAVDNALGFDNAVDQERRYRAECISYLYTWQI